MTMGVFVCVDQSKFLDEVKCVLRVLVLFLPLPVFWALFDQQVSVSYPGTNVNLLGTFHTVQNKSYVFRN